jgi:hypothetical protein
MRWIMYIANVPEDSEAPVSHSSALDNTQGEIP